MNNSRLIRFLRTLSPGEFKQFELFVQSPFFNQNGRLMDLVQLIREAAPSFSESLLNKERLFRKLFREEPEFREQMLHDLFSGLLRLFEQFVSHQQLQKSDYYQSELLMEGLETIGLTDHMERVGKKYHKKLEKEPYQQIALLKHEYHLSRIENTILRETGAGGTATASHLAEMSEKLDVYYLAEKLRITCEMANLQVLANSDKRPKLVEELSEFLQEKGKNYLEYPIIAIYHQIYLTYLEEGETGHFTSLKELLFKYSDSFLPGEAYSMNVYALNYCVRQINRGNDLFRQEIFSLFQNLLEKGLLFDGDYLPHSHYNNICNVALSLKKYEWVSDFLNTYKARLSPEYQENAFLYNLSVYHYEQKQYSEAMKLLQQIEFTNIFYHINAKNLLLRIYYELQDYDGIQYLTQAFTALLKRNQKIPKYQVHSHQNFVKHLKKMARLKRRKDVMEEEGFNERWNKMNSEVSQTSPLSHKRWIVSELGKLKESF